jgi:3-deoxy-D-manno-octulosonic-acid transferase
MLTRALYTAAWQVVAPLAPLRLWWRGRAEPGYRERIGERYGRYADAPPAGEVVWIHAVSVGETRAAAPLVERVRAARPGATIVVTSMTATGRETARALFAPDVVQAWLPYDLPGAMRRFLEHFHPSLGLVMETELWPNLVAEAAIARIPIFLVNARLSERSARGYARIGPLIRPLLGALAGVAAQTRADADRLEALGARDATVTGNLKFDIGVPADAGALARSLRALYGDRPVLLAASTRDGEEAMILDALGRRPLPAETLVVIVPRHPQRFDEVAALLRARAIAHVRRSGEPRRPGRRRRRAGRLDGRDARLLRSVGRRVRRRQPRAARRAEPDRGDRGGRAGARRAAHVQLRRGRGARGRGGGGDPRGRRRRPGREGRDAARRPRAPRGDARARAGLRGRAPRRDRADLAVRRGKLARISPTAAG